MLRAPQPFRVGNRDVCVRLFDGCARAGADLAGEIDQLLGIEAQSFEGFGEPSGTGRGIVGVVSQGLMLGERTPLFNCEHYGLRLSRTILQWPGSSSNTRVLLKCSTAARR
jgi:hypothetical protein